MILFLPIKPKWASAWRVSQKAFATLIKRRNVSSRFDFGYICCWGSLLPNKTKLLHFYFKIIANTYKELSVCQTACCVVYLHFTSCNLNSQTVDINIIYVYNWGHWSSARKMNLPVVIKLVNSKSWDWTPGLFNTNNMRLCTMLQCFPVFT